MRHLITMIALLALVDGSAAIAQPAGPRNPAAPPSVNSDQQMLPEAPVGHRQPRADQVPSEKNLMNPNDSVNQENAALGAIRRTGIPPGAARDGCRASRHHVVRWENRMLKTLKTATLPHSRRDFLAQQLRRQLPCRACRPGARTAASMSSLRRRGSCSKASRRHHAVREIKRTMRRPRRQVTTSETERRPMLISRPPPWQTGGYRWSINIPTVSHQTSTKPPSAPRI